MGAPQHRGKVSRPQPKAGTAKPKPNAKDSATSGVRVSKAEFAAGASAKGQIPAPGPVEIAFAGRSNVGKSSLLNMMLARKGLARTSRTPGCTRQINFFDVVLAGGPEVTFVDLPGYGYAKVSKSEARDWQVLLEGYLKERPTLRAVAILVDARRGPESEEIELVEFLRARRDLLLVLVATKIDKIPRSSQKVRLKELARESGVPVFGTSAETGFGREELWQRLLLVANRDADEQVPNADDVV